MGMYDDVICLLPLPGDISNDIRFQTKSLDSTLSLYIINNQGKLEDHGCNFDDHGIVNPIDDPELVDLHGYLTFYEMNYDFPGSHAYVWLEYEAKFTDGVCVSIERVPSWHVTEDGTRIYDEDYDPKRQRK